MTFNGTVQTIVQRARLFRAVAAEGHQVPLGNVEDRVVPRMRVPGGTLAPQEKFRYFSRLGLRLTTHRN